MGIYYQKTIESLVSPRLVTCTPDTPVHEAARQMREALCGSIIVLDGQGQPAGIWTEADVLKLDLHDPDGLRVPISSVMSSPVKTLPVDTPFHEAAIRFRHEGIRHYLVIDQQNQPRGILSQTDIVLNQGAEFFIRLKEVGSIPSAPPRFLRADASFAEAVAAMRQVTQEAVIIEYPDGGYGILTQRDVVRHLDSNDPDQPVGRLASRPLVTAKASASLYYARKLLAEKHIRHLG
ncbi:CBS domain-containing protein, partial [Laribacter hongkongensis]